MKKNIINTTPHVVKIVDGVGSTVKEFLPSGITFRLSAKTENVGTVDGVPISRTVYGEPQLVTETGNAPMPEEKEEVAYIVSAMVKAALPKRADLLVPAEQVRDSNGQIIGCKSLGL